MKKKIFFLEFVVVHTVQFVNNKIKTRRQENLDLDGKKASSEINYHHVKPYTKVNLSLCQKNERKFQTTVKVI